MCEFCIVIRLVKSLAFSCSCLDPSASAIFVVLMLGLRHLCRVISLMYFATVWLLLDSYRVSFLLSKEGGFLLVFRKIAPEL